MLGRVTGMRAPVVLAHMLVALALLTSCGGSAEDQNGISTSGDPSNVSGTGLQEHKPSGPYDLVLEDVRVVDHDGHDRVVLRFAGSGRPGWAVRFVEEAVLEGSGDVVELEGDAILQLDISGTPTLTPNSSGPVRSELGGDVVDVHAVGAYEGITQVFVGLRGGPTAFRVSALTDPPRLLVDLG